MTDREKESRKEIDRIRRVNICEQITINNITYAEAIAKKGSDKTR